MTWIVAVTLSTGDSQTIECDIYDDARTLLKDLLTDMMFGFVDPEAIAKFDDDDLIFYRHYGYGLEPRTNECFVINPTEIVSVEIWDRDAQ